MPYDGKFADESELISIIDKINQQVNRQSNRTTNMPPITLFSKEKEYLKPLPNKLLLESYIEGVLTQTVPSTLLVSYKGSGYSVPPKFINKRVKLIPIDNKLYIYYNELLVTVHSLSSNIFNYKNEHYSFQPSINKDQILNFKYLSFIGNKENIIFIGTPGVGKTHLATSIGIEAAKQRTCTYFISCNDLVLQLKRARIENRLEQRIKFFSKYS